MKLMAVTHQKYASWNRTLTKFLVEIQINICIDAMLVIFLFALRSIFCLSLFWLVSRGSRLHRFHCKLLLVKLGQEVLEDSKVEGGRKAKIFPSLLVILREKWSCLLQYSFTSLWTVLVMDSIAPAQWSRQKALKCTSFYFPSNLRVVSNFLLLLISGCLTIPV